MANRDAADEMFERLDRPKPAVVYVKDGKRVSVGGAALLSANPAATVSGAETISYHGKWDATMELVAPLKPGESVDVIIPDSEDALKFRSNLRSILNTREPAAAWFWVVTEAHGVPAVLTVRKGAAKADGEKRRIEELYTVGDLAKPECEHPVWVKAGTHRGGVQRLKCRDCGKTRTERPEGYRGGNHLSPEKEAALREALLSGISVNAAAKKAVVSEQTARTFKKDHNITALCACGKDSGHQGWCGARYSQSQARQEVVNKMHSNHNPPPAVIVQPAVPPVHEHEWRYTGNRYGKRRACTTCGAIEPISPVGPEGATVTVTERAEHRVETKTLERTTVIEAKPEMEPPDVPAIAQSAQLPAPRLDIPVPMEHELVALLKQTRVELQKRNIKVDALEYFDFETVLPTSEEPLSFLPAEGPEAARLLSLAIRVHGDPTKLPDRELERIFEGEADSLPALAESLYRHREAKRMTDAMLGPFVDRQGFHGDWPTWGSMFKDLWETVHVEFVKLLKWHAEEVDKAVGKARKDAAKAK